MNDSWLDTRWFAVTLVSLLFACLLGLGVLGPMWEKARDADRVFEVPESTYPDVTLGAKP